MSEPDEVRSELDKVTNELGYQYRVWKGAEKKKEESKKQFFELVNNEVNMLAERLVEISARDEAQAFDIVKMRYPRWIICDFRCTKVMESKRVFEFIIEENREYKTHSFTNPTDGLVYTRQVVAGSPQIDDERLREDDPELYEAVTYVPEPERQLRPLDELTDVEMAKLSEYMYEGAPIVKLAAPRKAKPEDLE